MDIFTTQLTKVRQVPIKPDKLRVKSLSKDASASALDEEKDHLTGETQSPDLHPLAHLHEDEEDLEYTKQEIFQAKKKRGSDEDQTKHQKTADANNDDDEDNDDHIDIFV